MTSHIYWTDMHSNIHHEDIDKLPAWIRQCRELFDFWPIAYYPYYMRKDESGLLMEDCYEKEIIQEDWEAIRSATEQQNHDGFAMFMGYEWQGSGKDGDHNVFFLNNHEDPYFPLRYEELRDHYKGKEVIAVPHHLAYQLGSRGKNWDTHDEEFSPVAEIYSSHGSSENDEDIIPMNRHVHMGPRTGRTSVEEGWKRGYHFGVIASGDNHLCPGIYGYGYMAVLADRPEKEEIWRAIRSRHVYGVSRDRIQLDFRIGDAMMGDVSNGRKTAPMRVDVVGANTIDRVEVIKDNHLADVLVNYHRDEIPACGSVKFKFRLECGWGPSPKVLAGKEKKTWQGELHTEGKLISVEKCWRSFGQEIFQKENGCTFTLHTDSTGQAGRWMGTSAADVEGFVFEIQADVNSIIHLKLNENTYDIPVLQILAGSMILPQMEEAERMIADQYGVTSYYRDDPWWHNAYKAKIGKGAVESEYHFSCRKDIDTTDASLVRVRVWQRDGSCAWSSPIFLRNNNR